MKYQGGFETFKEATRYMFETPSLSDVLFVIAGLSMAVLFLIVFPYLLSKHRMKKNLEREFFEAGNSAGLNEEEINLLWKCAKRIREPIKVMRIKYAFEKCVSELIKQDISAIDSISLIRRKLGFDALPWFLPLSSTRDIDIYQTGLLSHEGHAYSSAVWEKDEVELHIALLDNPVKDIRKGDRVKFSFMREGDGRYYFNAEVLRSYMDGVRLVLVLPHTDQLSKIQLREELRWKTRLPAKISIYKSDSSQTVEESFEGTIEDISPGGVRFCVQKYVEVKVDQKVFVSFELKSYTIEAFGTVRHVKACPEKTCFGIKLEGLKDFQRDIIRKFLIEEQRKLIRTYRIGPEEEQM